MIDERPTGHLELSDCLAEDPFGSVFRGLEWTAPRSAREVLVRQYHPIWLELGLTSRRHEILRNLVHLGHLKPFKGCHAGRDGSPRLIWPYAAGRSLAQVLKASGEQSLPLGIDQALFLVWALSHHIRQLHQVHLSPGLLSPHRIWIGFDGWIQLLDVPVINILEELLPFIPGVPNTLEAYLQEGRTGGLEQEAFQLGALLFEMLTHRPLPKGRIHAGLLRDARLGMPGLDQGPLPSGVSGLMGRLLGLEEPFRTLEELERTMEDSTFGGEFDPSTFGLAFAMQTLFRHEIAAASQESGQEQPAPVPGLPAGPAAAKDPGFPFRRAGLLAAALLLGGAAAWFGIQGKSRSGESAAAPSERLPVPAPTAPPAFKAEEAAIPPAPGGQTAGNPVKAPPQDPQPASNAQAASLPGPEPPPDRPVKLRVFVDEGGHVRQAHLVSGAEEGTLRERTAYAAAMRKVLPPLLSEGKAVRGWAEITVQVP